MRNRLFEKSTTFMALPAFVKLWMIPAWIMLGLSRLAVLVVPMRFLSRFLGVSAGIEARSPLLSERQRELAILVSRVIKLAARYAPWDANCFAQALTARSMMGLYGVPHAIYFGLMRDPATRDMKAHAWVGAGEVRVTGGDGFSSFTVVATYLSVAPQDGSR